MYIFLEYRIFQILNKFPLYEWKKNIYVSKFKHEVYLEGNYRDLNIILKIVLILSLLSWRPDHVHILKQNQACELLYIYHV